jgi:hypothetical protein
MKDFILRLVARLGEAERPLSRNRHFYTFDNPHGRKALRISRRLRSLERDIVEAAQHGEPVRIERQEQGGQLVRVRIEFVRLKARRTSFLSPAEYDLLLAAPAVRSALEGAVASA